MPAIRFMIGSSLALAACAFVAAADEDCHCENGFYEKVVTCYKKVCREEKIPTVVRKPYIRYENKPCPTTVMVKREFVIQRPQEVPDEQVVIKCRKVPVRIIDPDTGCSILTYKNDYYPVKVMGKKTIMVDVKVLRDVPEQRMEMRPCPVEDFRDITVFVTKQVCENVPYQKTIQVPCPPPGPNYRVIVPVDPRIPPQTREPGF